MPDMARALQKILPELETPQGREAKIGMLWITRPMSEVDMTAKLVDTFGDGAANNDIYLYRTIRCAFTGGESKCLVVYEK